MDDINTPPSTPTPPQPQVPQPQAPQPQDQGFFSQMTPKVAFIFGLLVGVSVLSTVGFLSVMKTGEIGFGASAGNKNNDTANDDVVIPTDDQAGQPQPDASAISIGPDDHIFGDPNAPITVVEFSDFQCPFCQQFHPTMKQLVENFPGKVRWIWKHFPLSFHPQAQQAAEASECAAEQGKFWEYADAMFENQALFSQAGIFEKLATDTGLNKDSFANCLSSGKYTEKVNNDYQMGVSAGVSGTPGSFINDVYVAGAKSYASLEQIVKTLE